MEEEEGDGEMIISKISRKLKNIPLLLKRCKLTPFLFPYVESCLLNLQDFNFSSQNASFLLSGSIGGIPKSLSQWHGSPIVVSQEKISQWNGYLQ